MCSKKLAIVTGSNKGIGYAIVKDLCARFDGDVYLTARDVNKGVDAIKRLKNLGLSPEFHQLDITDDASVTEFKSFIEKNYAGINILVNNAAILYEPDAVQHAVEVEETMNVNYFGLRKVCDILFPLLLPGARVVNLSSSSGHLSRIPSDKLKEKFSSPQLTVEELDDLIRQYIDSARLGNTEESGWPWRAYNVSKVGVSALTLIQQRAFDLDPRRDLIVNSVHPGAVDTDMIKHMSLTKCSIEEGAEAPVYLALLPEGEQQFRGQYVWCDKTIKDWYK